MTETDRREPREGVERRCARKRDLIDDDTDARECDFASTQSGDSEYVKFTGSVENAAVFVGFITAMTFCPFSALQVSNGAR